MTAIIHATLVLRDHLIPDGVLLLQDGKITAFGEARTLPVPEGARVIDAKGQFVGPGFVDIHTHASDRKFFTDDPVSCALHHLHNGTTTVLPALYFSMDSREYVAAIKKMKKAAKDPRCGNIGGVYMEGPYLNPRFGCDKEHNPWQGPVSEADYAPIVKEAAGFAKAWAVAPERENILEFVQAVKAADPNAVFTVAHSEASPAQIEALLPYGLRIGTHHTNATGTLEKYPECRGVCVDETVNYNREIYAELICDSRGIHVDPYMQRLIRKIKGEDRLILISDAYAADGPVPAGYEGVTDINFDHAGEIAGSKLTLNVACRNMMVHTGASVVDVFRYASYNPAQAVGLTDRGEIAVGKRADLVFTDYKMNVSAVLLEGKVLVGEEPDFCYATWAEKMGCADYPYHWAGWFDEVLEEYKAHGCPWTEPETYDDLQARLHCFTDTEFEVYRRAAEKGRGDRDLALFILLASRTLAEPEDQMPEVRIIGMPAAPADDRAEAYRMAQGFAVCSHLDDMVALLKSRKMPPELISESLHKAVGSMHSYERCHDGETGFDLISWAIRFLYGKIFNVGILEFDYLNEYTRDDATFRSAEGRLVTLGHPEQTEDGWTGLLFNERGDKTAETVTLSAAEWKCVLKKGDPVMGVHIPRGHHLIPEKVTETLQLGIQFREEHYPDFHPVAITCKSWLMSHELEELLPPESNILQFSSRFYRLATPNKGRAVFNFVFSLPAGEVDYSKLPENTRLERALKQYYLDGKAVYNMLGLILLG